MKGVVAEDGEDAVVHSLQADGTGGHLLEAAEVCWLFLLHLWNEIGKNDFGTYTFDFIDEEETTEVGLEAIEQDAVEFFEEVYSILLNSGNFSSLRKLRVF